MSRKESTSKSDNSTPRSRSNALKVLSHTRTPEIVVGLVGRIAAGVTTTAKQLILLLESKAGYRAVRIKVSDSICEGAPLVWPSVVELYKKRNRSEILERINTDLFPFKPTPAPSNKKLWLSSLPEHDKIGLLQDIGNELRKIDASFLAASCANVIAETRVDWGKTFGGIDAAYDAVPEGPRLAFIVDAFKSPDEIRLMRQVYGNRFILIAVLASEDTLERRLKYDFVKPEQAIEIANRDDFEGVPGGQDVRNAALMADIFLRNDFDREDHLRESLERYVDIILGAGIQTPSKDETAMHYAASAAARSSCLSRQVGAAIFSEVGELLAVGWNEVPKAGGGVYADEDGQSDDRCFVRRGCCSNDLQKQEIYAEITDALIRKLPISDKELESAIAQVLPDVLKNTRVRDLIEFSRAVHAEMAAIMQIAREGRIGLRGATMYCTTYPCHSCARHILAAGIKRVVYIEPYPKSLAIKLHGDAIAVSDKQGAAGPPPGSPKGRVGHSESTINSMLVLVPYDGVAPRNMIRFFEANQRRKLTDGSVVRYLKSELMPKAAPSRLSVEFMEATLYEMKMGDENGSDV